MNEYELSVDAQVDLLEIWHYIQERSGNRAADRVFDKLHDAMKKLATMPGMGQIRTDLSSEELPTWPVYSYLIVYQPSSKPIGIVRVIHGARDVEAVLRRR
jgi:antitoxin ParD1/3/4/toxin ParE1/3/4